MDVETDFVIKFNFGHTQQIAREQMTVPDYLFQSKHLGIKNCRHGVFAYNRNDAFIGMSLDQYGEWCEFEIPLLRQFVNIGDTVIDVGANIGTHTIPLANFVGPSGFVIAFEPQPRLFNMLATNATLNSLENVCLHRNAVGAEKSVITMQTLPPSDTFFNFGAVPLTGDKASENVECVTIDDLRLENCSLIKADAEGMESDIIAGAVETIEKYKPILYVENNGNDSEKISNALDEINYRAAWSLGNYFNPNNFYANPVNRWPNVMPSANLLCVPNKPAKTNRHFHIYGLPFEGAADNWSKASKRAPA